MNLFQDGLFPFCLYKSPKGVISEHVNQYIPMAMQTPPRKVNWPSVVTRLTAPTLRVVWCLIWWFASIEKECGHWMSLLKQVSLNNTNPVWILDMYSCSSGWFRLALPCSASDDANIMNILSFTGYTLFGDELLSRLPFSPSVCKGVFMLLGDFILLCPALLAS